MTPEDPRVEQLLDELLNSPLTPEQVCAESPELLPIVRKRWRKLKRLSVDLDSLFPVQGDPQAAGTELPNIPGYEVEAVLGRGGMGIIYRVRHLTLNRVVALKMLLLGEYAGAVELARFTREAQAIAALQHPNIVQIYDVGEVDGRAYFTMELVGGGSLSQKLEGTPQPAQYCAGIAETLAHAIHAAHHAGIVHRDLKPANILLTPDGTPKVSDFGLARHFEGQADVTLDAGRVGTPSYMAPEQVLGKPGTVGPSADVYALGATLYEMLVGRPPFRGETPSATEQQLLTQEPVPPSRLNAKVPRDLDTICLKCLQKQPDKRYATAADLAADLARFSRNEPIHARPVGSAERTLRWMSRHKGLTTALAGVVFLLLVLAVGSLIAATHFRASEQKQTALALEKGRLAAEETRQRELASAAGKREAELRQREAGLRQRAENQGDELRRNLYFTQMNLTGQAALSPGGIGYVLERLSPWENGHPDLREWEWYYLNGLCHRDLLTLRGHLRGVTCVAWSPDGQKLASTSGDGTAVIWNAADGRVIAHCHGHGAIVYSAAWSPDSRRMATVGNRSIRIWNGDNGGAIATFEAPRADVVSVAWSPDGSRLALGDIEGTIHLWNAETGSNIHMLHGHTNTVSGVAWTPDGSRLASAGQDATVRIWDPMIGKETVNLPGHKNGVNAVAWNRDGTRLASASNDRTVKIWDPAAGKEVLTFARHTQEVSSVAWSPDGAYLATSSEDQTVKIWRADGGADIRTLRGHARGLTAVVWSPNGKRLASSSLDMTVKVWDPKIVPELLAMNSQEGAVNALAWRGDSQHLVSASTDGTLKVWDISQHVEQSVIRGHLKDSRGATWSADGRWIAAAGSDGTIHVWNAATAAELTPLQGHTGDVYSLAWSSDNRLASAGADRTVRIWDPMSGAQIWLCDHHLAPVRSVAWHPKGLWLVSGAADGNVIMWNSRDGQPSLAFTHHTGAINALAWSPDGKWLAEAGGDQTITIASEWPGKLSLILRGHTARVNDVAWSPNGARLASASDDKTVKIWDAATGKETLTLDGAGQAAAVAWSPDGFLLASSGSDQTIVIHDATRGYRDGLAQAYLPTLDRRLASAPKDPALWSLRARIHAGIGDWDSAAKDLRSYLALKEDERWCTMGYWVAGPYPEDLNGHYPPETKPDPCKQVASVAETDRSLAPLNWQPVPLNSAGFVNLGPLFGNADHISAYALLRIYCKQETRVAILLSADDQVRLWLNGAQIHENLTEHPAMADAEAVGATLAPGWNTLLARVVNVRGDHVLYLRLSDAPTDLARTRAIRGP